VDFIFGKPPGIESVENNKHIEMRLDKNDDKATMELQQQDISPALHAKLQKC